MLANNANHQTPAKPDKAELVNECLRTKPERTVNFPLSSQSDKTDCNDGTKVRDHCRKTVLLT